jgi:hypothetical protein
VADELNLNVLFPDFTAAGMDFCNHATVSAVVSQRIRNCKVRKQVIELITLVAEEWFGCEVTKRESSR